MKAKTRHVGRFELLKYYNATRRKSNVANFAGFGLLVERINVRRSKRKMDGDRIGWRREGRGNRRQGKVRVWVEKGRSEQG